MDETDWIEKRIARHMAGDEHPWEWFRGSAVMFAGAKRTAFSRWRQTSNTNDDLLTEWLDKEGW